MRGHLTHSQGHRRRQPSASRSPWRKRCSWYSETSCPMYRETGRQSKVHCTAVLGNICHKRTPEKSSSANSNRTEQSLALLHFYFDLQCLLRQGYLDFSTDVQEKLALHAFLRGLCLQRLCEHVHLALPASLMLALGPLGALRQTLRGLKVNVKSKISHSYCQPA